MRVPQGVHRGKVGKLSVLSKDEKYTVTFLKLNGEKTASHTRIRGLLLIDQLIPGYDLNLTAEEIECIERDSGHKKLRAESNRSESLKLVGKVVRFISGMFMGKLGVVNSVSMTGLCNTSLCFATDTKRTAHPYARPHTLEAVEDDTVLTEEQKESLDAYRSIKEKQQLSKEQKQLQKVSPKRNGRRKRDSNSDNNDDNNNDDNDYDENNNDENSPKKIKVDKVIKKEYPLTGKYVRIQSGSFAGKLGRAVNHTVGNIYCVCVLNEADEKRRGRQTSVTASRLEEIDVTACNEAELLSIEDDKLNIIKREEKRMLFIQRNQQEKDRAKQARVLSAARDDDSDTQSRTSSKLPEIPSNAVDSYVRVQTGRYTGYLARVTTFVGRYRCTVRILEFEGSSKCRGTTVTTTNFCPADLTSLSEEDNDKYLYDLKTKQEASLDLPYPGAKPTKRVFKEDLTGRYIRLHSGLYGGKIARVTHCTVGTSPCYVKVVH